MVVIDRCTKILNTLFEGVEINVQNDRVDSNKQSFFYKNNRLLEIAIISKKKNIFKYTVDFKLIVHLLNKSQARIKRDKILTVQKYHYNLGHILTAKYLTSNQEPINYEIYSEYNKTISIALDLTKITGAFISEESFAYVDDEESVEYTNMALLNIIIDNKIYPIKIDPVILDDSSLCLSICESLLNNNLKDDMMVTF